MTDQILEWRAQSPLSKSTRKMYAMHLRKAERWLVEKDLEFEDLGPSLFSDYLDEHRWAHTTRRNALSAVRSYLRFLGDYDHRLFGLRLQNSRSRRILKEAKSLTPRSAAVLEKFEEFLAERAYATRSAEKYRDYMEGLVGWLEREGYALAELQPVDYLRYLDSNAWGDKTRHNAFYSLKPYVRWRYGQGHPLNKMRVRKPPDMPQRTLTQEQVDQLIDFLDTSNLKNIRDLAMISLMLDQGLRASEVCRLKLNDVDLSRRSYHVIAKGNKLRVGIFSETTRERMSAWIQVRRSLARNDADTFFVSVGGSKPGMPLTRRGLGSIIRRLGKEAGIGPISPHDFRRTFATLALRNGAPTRLVQLAGGWSKIDMVERYSQALTAEDFEGYFPTEKKSTPKRTKRPTRPPGAAGQTREINRLPRSEFIQ